MQAVELTDDEVQAAAEMEPWFGLVDQLTQLSERGSPSVQAGSAFAEDHARYNWEHLGDWCWQLTDAALDHLHLLRLTAGKPPGGSGLWHRSAPWSLCRSALESSSQALWLLGPESSAKRVERLLRLIHEDFEQAAKMQRCSNAADGGNRTDAVPADAALRDLSLRSVGLAEVNKVNAELKLVDCVRDAAKTAGLVKPDQAELLWRLASGMAHGRLYAPLTAGRTDDQGRVDDRRFLGIQSLDLVQFSAFLALAVGTTRTAYEIVYRRAGQGAAPPPQGGRRRR